MKNLVLILLGVIFHLSLSGQNCSASYSFTNAPANPFMYSFNNTSTTSNLGFQDTVMYLWHFGDGDSSTITSPFHTYSSNGTYTVCVEIKVIDSIGSVSCSNTFCDTVIIAQGTNCQADFVYLIDALNSLSVDFTDSSTVSSFIPSSNVLSIWDYGDGTMDTTTGQLPRTHTYAISGNYTVCLYLEVYDNNSQLVCTDSSCRSLNVSIPLSCNSGFTASVDSSNSRLISFNSTASYQPLLAGYSDSVTWDFGDGSAFESGDLVTHTYGLAQSYSVCQIYTVLDSIGNIACSDTTCQVITINADTSFCNVLYIIDTVNSYQGNVYIWNVSTPLNNDPDFMNSYFWDFGNGSTSTQAYPTHSYPGPGDFEVCLTLTSIDQNLDTCITTYCDSINVDANGNLNGIGGNGFVLRVLNPETISIDEFQKEEFKVYPNPASDFVNVDVPNDFRGELQWIMFGLNGQKIKDGNWDIKQEQEIKLDIQNIESGMYMLLIQNEFSVYHYKLEINRW